MVSFLISSFRVSVISSLDLIPPLMISESSFTRSLGLLLGSPSLSQKVLAIALNP